MGSKTEEFVKTLEPLADRHGMSAEGCMLASIAISLKRIADAIEGGLFTAPINSYGEGIGDAIQGQIVRGMRGIDQYER